MTCECGYAIHLLDFNHLDEQCILCLLQNEYSIKVKYMSKIDNLFSYNSFSIFDWIIPTVFICYLENFILSRMTNWEIKTLKKKRIFHFDLIALQKNTI